MKILITGEGLSSTGVIRQSAGLFSQLPIMKSVTENDVLPIHTLQQQPTEFFKGINRIVGKRGYEFFNIPIGEVACFYTERRVIYFITRKGQKYLSEFNSLAELYDALDKKYFYRINRKQIISVTAVRKFRSFERLKILVDLEIETPFNLVVSQGNAPFFRKWIRQQ